MPSSSAQPIAVLNRCTVMDDAEAEAMVHALQVQVSRDFVKPWKLDARLRYVPKDDTRSWRGAWNLLLLDYSDEANALGYHDQTPEGQPVGKAFLATDRQVGAEPSVTVSHELLEMVLDPHINLTAFDSRRGVFVAYEACDAVEADDLAYDIDGVRVSDFVLPAYFDPSAYGRKPERFSFFGNVHNPFQLAHGGYEILFVPGRGWTQQVAREGTSALDRPRVGSRRERRMNRDAWELSAA